MSMAIDEKLKDILTSDLSEYKSIPFWSWNSKLDEGELCRQIDDIHAAGMGGFIIHARTGLQEEYLGEKWFSCISACLQKAKSLQMQVWIYDENGWPSGFVGGKLLENEAFRARFLEYETGAFDPEAYACFVKTQTGYTRTESPIAGTEEYHNVYLRISPANTDILNPDVVEAFIQETHEKYYERFAESFGKELVGFFTDEPQFYRWATPYTPCAEGYFEDIRDGLIWLFVSDEAGWEFRTKYYGVLNNLYTENFYKKLYDWCENHHCKLTGHSVEEGCLHGQMYGGAAVMPSYEYEHIPGIDWLGRECSVETAPRQVASVASQLGKKQILTETFGCCGYDVTPRELKSIGQAQYFHGVNLMCQHLYPYSMAGRGKTDHPPVFSPHGNWFEGFKEFNTYFDRLGCIVTNTEDRYDVAVLHPVRAVWLNYLRTQDDKSVASLQEKYDTLLQTLRKNGILFHFVDETILEQHGSIENGNLKVGNCVYDKLIIPDMESVSAYAYRLLMQYSGKLLLMGELTHIDGVRQKVSLCSNTTMEELISLRQIPFFCEDTNTVLTARKGEIGDFLFLQNISSKESSDLHLEEIAPYYCRLDLEQLEISPIAQMVTLKPWEGMILLRDASTCLPVSKETEEDITDSFAVTDISENYLVLDRVSISKDGVNYSEVLPVPGCFELLLRENYRGKLFVRHTFTVKDVVPLKLMMERNALLSATVNGQNITLKRSGFDVNFVEADITDAVKVGENVFTYTLDFYQHEGVHFALFDPMATESLRNCLYFDTSIENVYLTGSFTLDQQMSIMKAEKHLPITSRMYEYGYPFFNGELTLTGSLYWDGEKQVMLEIAGRYQTAEVSLNGRKTHFVLDDRKDITRHLLPGVNTVTVTLRSSLRNLFGPHHFKLNPEPTGVSPDQFEFRGQWEQGKTAKYYTPNYHFVPFGADKIVLITKNGNQSS